MPIKIKIFFCTGNSIKNSLFRLLKTIRVIMKILQINSVCGNGSTGRIVLDLSSVLTDNNIENYILYGYGKSNYDLAKRIGGKFNIRQHQISTRFWGWHGFSSKKTTLELIDKLKEIKPDIIHLHNIHGFYINIEILFNYIKEQNIKTVWTLHDCWAFTGHCSYFDISECNKWQKLCNNCPNKKDYPISYFFDRSKEQFKKKKELFCNINNLTIVTPSNWLANLVKESFLSCYPIKVINNGIDLTAFHPQDNDFRKKYNLESKFVILAISMSLNTRKGIDYIFDLSNKLGDDCKIVLLGLDKNDTSKIPNNILAIERTNSINELAQIYSAVDVFVNPTLEDNFPTVNIEALACGTPVITFNTGGSPEAISDNTGIITKEKSTQALLNAINIIKKNTKNYYKKNCIKRANELYNKEKKYNEYIALYKSIIGNSHEKNN